MIRSKILPVFFATTLSVLSLPAFAQDKPAAPEATMVGADTVRFVEVSQTVPVSGRLVARQSSVVAARINAPVHEVLVEVGDNVEQDQVLIKLLADRLTHNKELAMGELERSMAALQTSKAQFNIVSQELKRLARLRKSAAFNQARYDDKNLERLKAQSAVGEAEAAVRKAKADLALAELDLDYTEIKAPFPGTITQRQVDRGNYVSVGQTVLNIVNANNLEIEADVPAVYAPNLETGISVQAILTNQQNIPLKVRAVIPEENPLTRTRAVRFTPDFDLKDYKLASNQTLNVLIPQDKARKVLSVHKDAVLSKKGGNIVFAIKEGKATITPVKLGNAHGPFFEVLGGLAEGDVVVVRGNERLRPNQPVKAMRSDT
ncbi:efflux RND transporter periplasmic adaptor subunit [Terasakiella sp. A23]|uniref:efflux RND transporter periplasmic adaptor subunit n=1 Tax=Terasakiella sp. FCG-A23 TaxID=3080561 RepID=UPI002955153B|nr:efflux RND transporter periplasmic adaptor subunit [Terasakiella sp. A23]MDV7340132.1 efflux RND transporter periplasmic adaptor subunit [Terasakiella sp. A23]